MSYENAPATRLLATYCACCSRPLVDAESVTAGMGPHCRKAHGVPMHLDEETRAAANKLVWEIAFYQHGEQVDAALVMLASMGCDALVGRIADRLGRRVTITIAGDVIELKAPYNAHAVHEMRTVAGRRWNGERKVTTFPVRMYGAMLQAISRGYGDSTMVSHAGRTTSIGSLIADHAANLAAQPPEPSIEDAKPVPRVETDRVVEDLPETTPFTFSLECRRALAETLKLQLEAAGFEQVFDDNGTKEEVWERVVTRRDDKPECGHRVRVFTSIENGMVRSTGEDAIRVVGVVRFWTKRSGAWKLGAKAISRETRVHRTGTIGGIINRTIHRARAAFKACREDAANGPAVRESIQAAKVLKAAEDFETRCENEAARREERWAHG